MKRNFKKVLSFAICCAIMFSIATTAPLNASAQISNFEFDNFSITYTITNNWADNQNIQITLTNTGTKPIRNWALQYNFHGTIAGIWDAQVYGEDIITGAMHNSDIAVGASVSFGYTLTNATGIPDSFALCNYRVEKESGYTVDMTKMNDWGSGFSGIITISNTTNTPIMAWELGFSANFTITNAGDFVIIENDDTYYKITGFQHNGNIPANSSVTLQFNAESAPDAAIFDFSLTEIVVSSTPLDDDERCEICDEEPCVCENGNNDDEYIPWLPEGLETLVAFGFHDVETDSIILEWAYGDNTGDFGVYESGSLLAEISNKTFLIIPIDNEKEEYIFTVKKYISGEEPLVSNEVVMRANEDGIYEFVWVEGVYYYISAEAEYDPASQIVSISWEATEEAGTFEIFYSFDNADNEEYQFLAAIEGETSYDYQTDGEDFIINYFKVIQIVDEEIVAESNVCFVIWSPDGICWTEYTREWTIEADDEILSEINDDNPHYQVSVSFEASGVPDVHFSVAESGYSYAISNEAILGVAPEFIYDDALIIDNVTLSFEVADEFLDNALGIFNDDPELDGIKRLNFFMWIDEINMLLPIETKFDMAENIVYTEVDRFGTFCLMDMEMWISGFDLDFEEDEYEEEFEEEFEPFAPMMAGVAPMSAGFNNPSKKSTPIDIVFLLQTEGCSGGLSPIYFGRQKQTILYTADRIFEEYSNARIYIIEYKQYSASFISLSSTNYFTSSENIALAIENLTKNVLSSHIPANKGAAYSLLMNNFSFRASASKFIINVSNGCTDVFSGYSNEADLYNNIEGLNFSELSNYGKFSEMSMDIIDKSNGFWSFDASGYTLWAADYIFNHIVNNVVENELPTEFNAIIASGWKTIKLDTPPQKGSDTDTDKDELPDWDEIATDNTGLIKLTDCGNFIEELPTIQRCIDFASGILPTGTGEVFRPRITYVEEGLTRFKNSFNQNVAIYGLNTILNELRILPINSDPTNEDSDGDGWSDDIDPEPLINHFADGKINFSAFKVGDGNEENYKIDDYNGFINSMRMNFKAKALNRYATGDNINISGEFKFNYLNLRAMLESDIAYISAHAYNYDTQIFISRTTEEEAYRTATQILTAKSNFPNDGKEYFSLNMNAHRDAHGNSEIGERLKWLIIAACNQLNDTHNNVDLWVDVLRNNPKMKGILSYYSLAPDRASKSVPDNNVIWNFLENSYEPQPSNGMCPMTIYDAWIHANVSTNWRKTTASAALLVKSGYENEVLTASLLRNEDTHNGNIYLYKAIPRPFLFPKIDKSQPQTANIMSIVSSIGANVDAYEIFEISREVYNNSGEFLFEENVEHIYKFEQDNQQSIFISYNIDTQEIELFGGIIE